MSGDFKKRRKAIENRTEENILIQKVNDYFLLALLFFPSICITHISWDDRTTERPNDIGLFFSRSDNLLRICTFLQHLLQINFIAKSATFGKFLMMFLVGLKYVLIQNIIMQAFVLR